VSKQSPDDLSPINLQKIQQMKAAGEPISMITAYDYPSGRLADASQVDIVLVGDSVGMVVHGFETTLPVTMDMMILHCQAVRRGVKRALLIGDMPFGSYQVDIPSAKKNAMRFLAEGKVDAIKLEGGEAMAETVRALVDIGIAVQGHIGLTPQSISAMGGFKVQGKSLDTARQLLADAWAIEEAGAFSIVLEGIPARLASLITRRLDIPTIGIGAGAGCSGQVLVWHDILGLTAGHTPRFVKQYGEIGTQIIAGINQYSAEVKARIFPTPAHEYALSDEVWEQIESELGDFS
jgi:3-methyl-2-oxobutanoate hydroxymethyltransferase